VDGRLSSFQFFSHQIFIIKGVLNLVFYKIDFGMFSAKVFYKTKTQFIKLNIFFEFFNTHLNYLAQFLFINMTLKWHYIIFFERIDSSLVI